MNEVLLLITLLMLFAWGVRQWRRRGERAWMPTELRGATVAYAEQLFRAPGPSKVTAKVDRVYRLRSGRLILIELKTRRVDCTYLSDVIELSAQRVAITGQTGEGVAAHAYVVVHLPSGRRTAHRVELLGAVEVDALVRRREAILAGIVRPRFACAPALCERCAFENKCVGVPTASRTQS